MIPPAVDEIPELPSFPEPAAPQGLGADRPDVADAHEERLVAAGLSASLAKDIVAEAVAHGLPFAQPRSIKKLIRTALARRMPVMADLGGDARTIAFVGAGGSGKTSATERLAAAYAAADAEVAVVTLRAADGGAGLAARLAPAGVSVIAADSAEEAARRLARRQATLTIVDTPGRRPERPRRRDPDRRRPADARRHRGPPRPPGHAQRGRRRRAGLRAGAARPHARRAHARRPDRPPGRAGRARRQQPPRAVLRVLARRDRARRPRRTGEAAPPLIDYGRLRARPIHPRR